MICLLSPKSMVDCRDCTSLRDIPHPRRLSRHHREVKGLVRVTGGCYRWIEIDFFGPQSCMRRGRQEGEKRRLCAAVRLIV